MRTRKKLMKKKRIFFYLGFIFNFFLLVHFSSTVFIQIWAFSFDVFKGFLVSIKFLKLMCLFDL